MKAEGKAKWFIDALMEFILDRDAELAENKEFSSQLKEFIGSLKPAKKKSAGRKSRTAKALDVPPGLRNDAIKANQGTFTGRINGADTGVTLDQAE